jgi:hypothetical protein
MQAKIIAVDFDGTIVGGTVWRGDTEVFADEYWDDKAVKVF